MPFGATVVFFNARVDIKFEIYERTFENITFVCFLRAASVCVTIDSTNEMCDTYSDLINQPPIPSLTARVRNEKINNNNNILGEWPCLCQGKR